MDNSTPQGFHLSDAVYCPNKRGRLWPRIADGRIRPVISQVFGLDQVQDAHRLMESNRHIGKIVLAVAPDGA